MTFEEYEKFVGSRSIYPGSGTLVGALYCALKMAGEAGELLEHVELASGNDLIQKEAGDVLWYVFASKRELKFDLPQGGVDLIPLWVNKESLADWAKLVSINVSKYTECLGKALRDDGVTVYPGGREDTAYFEQQLSQERASKLQSHLVAVLVALAGVAHAYRINLSDIAEMNAVKLRDRDARGVTNGDGDNR